MSNVDHYAVLGLDAGATSAEVRRAYRLAARASHPDAGGSPEAFRAVSLAFEVLSDPAKRAAYDREVSGIGDWDDLGWGTDHDDPVMRPAAGAPDVPAAPPSEPSAGPAATETGDSWDTWEAGPRDPSEQPAEPVDAYRSDPRELPDPMSAPPPPVPRLRPPLAETATSIAALTLAAATVIVGARGPWRSLPPDFDLVGTALMVGSWNLSIVMAVAVVRAVRGLIAVAVTIALIGPLMFLPAAEASPAFAWVMALAWLATLVGYRWARLFSRRRHHPARERALDLAHRRARVERFRRADAWNALLRARLDDGAVLRQLGPVSAAAGTPASRPRWVRDPVTGLAELLVLDPRLPEHAWVAIDERGRVVATAPHGAPEAWLELLTSDAGSAAR